MQSLHMLTIVPTIESVSTVATCTTTSHTANARAIQSTTKTKVAINRARQNTAERALSVHIDTTH